MHHGVYAVGYAPQTLDAHFMAAVLAGGDDAFLSRWATCALAGQVRWNGGLIDVTVRGSASRIREGIRFHRALAGPPRHQAHPRHPDDHARAGDPRDLATAVRPASEAARAQGTGRAGRERAAVRGDAGAGQRPGRDAADRRDHRPGGGRSTAATRTRCSTSCSTTALSIRRSTSGSSWARPRAERRTSPTCAGRRNYLILEIDSAWHDDPLSQQLDALRQAELEAAGERVLRTTKEQACEDPRQLFARLDAAGAPRRQWRDLS